MKLSKSLLPGACLGILLVASVAGAQVQSEVLASGERGRQARFRDMLRWHERA